MRISHRYSWPPGLYPVNTAPGFLHAPHIDLKSKSACGSGACGAACPMAASASARGAAPSAAKSMAPATTARARDWAALGGAADAQHGRPVAEDITQDASDAWAAAIGPSLAAATSCVCVCYLQYLVRGLGIAEGTYKNI